MNDNIEIKPENEKPKKVNKLILIGIVFAISALMGYLLVPTGDSKKETDKSNQTTTQTGSTISQQLKDEQNKKKSDKPVVDDQQNGKSTDGIKEQSKNETHQIDVQEDNVRSTAPAPTIVQKQQPSAYEQYQEQKKQRLWAREEQQELDREDARQKANESAIFFDLSREKENQSKDTNAGSQSVNDYYNNSSSNSSSYISVVGNDQSKTSFGGR